MTGAASTAKPAAHASAPGRLLLAAPRAVLLASAMLGFFAAGVPLQLRRVRRGASDDRLPKLFCRVLLRLVGVHVEVRGTPAGPAALLVSNHLSWIDVPALASVLPFCFLAKAEVSRWPLVSSFAAVQGTVFVDRRRRRSILPANRLIADRLAAGRHVLIFPEGTTLAGPLPGPFLSSHFAAAAGQADPFRSGAPPPAVQPVAIAYSSPRAAWTGDETLLGHLLRTLAAPPLRCTIVFGEPLSCDGGRKAAARRARAAVAALIGGAAGGGRSGEEEVSTGSGASLAERHAGPPAPRPIGSGKS